MTGKRYIAVCFSLFFIAMSQDAFAGDKSISIYTPYTFATNAIAYSGLDSKNEETTIEKGTANGKFGVGVNFGFQKNSSVFIEKTAPGDSLKNIYIAGVKFNSKDAILSNSSREETATQDNNGFKLIGDFIKVSYILGLARITQNEGLREGDGTVAYSRTTGYNGIFGLDILPMKSANLHFVPLRFILTLGKSGTSALVSTEIGLSLPGL